MGTLARIGLLTHVSKCGFEPKINIILKIFFPAIRMFLSAESIKQHVIDP